MIFNREALEQDRKTKKDRNLTVELTDQQYDSLCRYAFKAGYETPGELLASFAADLSGWHSNGSDEEDHAGQWFHRAFDYMGGDSSFLFYLYDNDADKWDLEDIITTTEHEPDEIYDECDGQVETYADNYPYDWYEDYVDAVCSRDAQSKEDCLALIRKLLQEKNSPAICWR